MTEKPVTHIISLLTEVVGAVAVMVTMAVEGSASGFTSGPGVRGCLGLVNGGSTSLM